MPGKMRQSQGSHVHVQASVLARYAKIFGRYAAKIAEHICFHSLSAFIVRSENDCCHVIF